MRHFSLLLLLPIFLLSSCASTKNVVSIEQSKEKEGIIIGRIDGKILSTNSTYKIKCEEVVLMDWYIYREISAKPDSNGFFAMPVERNTIFWLRKAKFRIDNAASSYYITIDLTILSSSSYYLRQAAWVNTVTNVGSIEFDINDENTYSLKYNYDYQNILRYSLTIDKMIKYKGFRLINGTWSNG